MKVRVFADVYVGCRPENIFISVSPSGPVSPGCTRCEWELVVPDMLIYGDIGHSGGLVEPIKEGE